MPHLLARANEALLEAQCLRREGRALRIEAATRASALGKTILRSAVTVETRKQPVDPDQPAASS
jgi:hypothetical protein